MKALRLDFENGEVVEIGEDEPIENVLPVGFVVARTANTDPSEELGGTWALLGSQVIGATTVYYFERTSP